jgi:hypothetical protein
MAVVEHRIQKIFTVDRIPSNLLNPWALAFFEDHPIEKLIALLHADILSYHIINIIIWIQDFHLNMEQARLALDPYKVPRLFVEQFAIDINLHV